MKTSIIVTLLALLLAKNAACGDNSDMKLKDLPQGILQEFLVLLKGQKLVETVECGNPKPEDFDLLWYTRDSKNDPIALDLNGQSPIQNDKRLIFIIHGWIQSSTGYGIQELKDAYLDRYDSNVVVVDWGKLAFDLYSRAVCKLPKIAQIIATYLSKISDENGVDLGDVQLVGHSLGGQMSGLIGQATQQISGKHIGRITGLDPAGPLYENAPKSRRLDQTDADFVDVMHTNSKVFGYYEPCGHADFYVNCGVYQPSCVEIPTISINGLLNVPISAVSCSHSRAIDYMIEGVQTNNFIGSKCEYCPIGCPPVISGLRRTETAILGQQCPPTTRGKYFVLTDVKSPYAIANPMGR